MNECITFVQPPGLMKMRLMGNHHSLASHT